MRSAPAMMRPTYCLWAGLIGPARPSSIKLAKPMMKFRGVRISCEITERNSSL
ncbi:hypothetical protein D3C72_759540 [compost metagenome]